MRGVISLNSRLIWLLVVALTLINTVPAGAYTKWNGLFFLENTHASNPDNTTNLFQSGVNLSIRPPTKKNLNTLLSIRLDYTNADGESLWNVSPIGNLAVDMSGDTFALNLQHIRTATITTAAELVENKTYRVSLSLFPEYWPTITTRYSRLENAIDGKDYATSDLYSIYADYDFRRWLNVRTGYDYQKRTTGNSGKIDTQSLLLGLGINRQIMARTQLTGDASYVHNTSDASSGFNTTSDSYALRLGVESRPSPWFGVGSHYSLDIADSKSGTSSNVTTESQYYDLTGSVYPLYGARLWGTLGNRTYDGETDNRSVDYFTMGGSLNRDIGEKASLNVTGTHTLEQDPDLGDNTRDSISLSSLIDLTPRSSLNFSINITRNESPAFINTAVYDASGPLAIRDLYDDEPAGFTFFDTDNDDLYTKISIFHADWSEPVRVDPPNEKKFFINKTVQTNLQVTDNLTVTLYGGFNSSSKDFDLLAVDRKIFNGTLLYQPNRRTSYSMTGSYSMNEDRADNYNGTFSVNYRLWRGHQLNMSYGRRTVNREPADTFIGNLRLILPKRSNLELIYAASQLFDDEQTDYVRVRFTHSF